MRSTSQLYSDQIGDGQIRMMRVYSHNGPPHRHSFFELVYVLRGSATHHLGDETMRISAGDYFIIDTGTTHFYRDADQFQIMNCLFLPAYLDRALADCPSLASLLSNQVMHFGVPMDIRAADRTFHDGDSSVKQLMLRMEQEYEAKSTGYMELLRCYLTQILVHTVRAWQEAERARVPHPAVTAVTTHLQNHIDAPLSLELLGAKNGYTPQYLSTLFRKDTGMSIREFQQRLRIEEACRLLTDGKMRIPDIAATVGYSDAKHFSRIFRRYKGVSPQLYRKNAF